MTRNGFGLPLDETTVQNLLDESCRLATPFNIKSLRVLARRAEKRTQDYNETLNRVGEGVEDHRWVLWAAARNATRRLELALARTSPRSEKRAAA